MLQENVSATTEMCKKLLQLLL